MYTFLEKDKFSVFWCYFFETFFQNFITTFLQNTQYE